MIRSSIRWFSYAIVAILSSLGIVLIVAVWSVFAGVGPLANQIVQVDQKGELLRRQTVYVNAVARSLWAEWNGAPSFQPPAVPEPSGAFDLAGHARKLYAEQEWPEVQKRTEKQLANVPEEEKSLRRRVGFEAYYDK